MEGGGGLPSVGLVWMVSLRLRGSCGLSRTSQGHAPKLECDTEWHLGKGSTRNRKGPCPFSPSPTGAQPTYLSTNGAFPSQNVHTWEPPANSSMCLPIIRRLSIRCVYNELATAVCSGKQFGSSHHLLNQWLKVFMTGAFSRSETTVAREQTHAPFDGFCCGASEAGLLSSGPSCLNQSPLSGCMRPFRAILPRRYLHRNDPFLEAWRRKGLTMFLEHLATCPDMPKSMVLYQFMNASTQEWQLFLTKFQVCLALVI